MSDVPFPITNIQAPAIQKNIPASLYDIGPEEFGQIQFSINCGTPEYQLVLYKDRTLLDWFSVRYFYRSVKRQTHHGLLLIHSEFSLYLSNNGYVPDDVQNTYPEISIRPLRYNFPAQYVLRNKARILFVVGAWECSRSVEIDSPFYVKLLFDYRLLD